MYVNRANHSNFFSMLCGNCFHIDNIYIYILYCNITYHCLLYICMYMFIYIESSYFRLYDYNLLKYFMSMLLVYHSSSHYIYVRAYRYHLSIVCQSDTKWEPSVWWSRCWLSVLVKGSRFSSICRGIIFICGNSNGSTYTDNINVSRLKMYALS